jgi:hypothetical protein
MPELSIAMKLLPAPSYAEQKPEVTIFKSNKPRMGSLNEVCVFKVVNLRYLPVFLSVRKMPHIAHKGGS